MCTAVSFKTKDHYFGRNLDLEYALCESVTVTPRHYLLRFRHLPQSPAHYAMIGVASVIDGYPLYYDATNEAGLSAAGLRFAGHAAYSPTAEEGNNVAVFEFIPFLLGRCRSIAEVRALLSDVRLTDDAFSEAYPPAPLHWLISDRDESIVVEPMAGGLRVFSNPVGVLTNNPPFDYHLTNLNNYLSLSEDEPKNAFSPALDLKAYSRGMGALGLPGDLSSASRFVRAAFMRAHALCADGNVASVTQLLHILSSVRHLRGSVMIGGKPEITLYSSCCNTDTGAYYYTTYENSQITCVDMRREDLSSTQLISYPLIMRQQIAMQN